MKIQFKNVGNIKNFEFNLIQGMTLFCGQNSTGKTYAAYVIFSMLTHLEKIPADWIKLEDVETLIKNGNIIVDLNKICESDDFLKEISKTLAQRLASDFDAPRDFFPKDCVKITDFRPRKNKSQKTKEQITNIEFGNIKIGFQLNNEKISISAQILLKNGFTPNIPTELLLKIINMNISLLFANRNFGNVHVLTAERAAINLFSRELSSSRNNLIDQLLGLESEKGKKNSLNLGHFLDKKTTRYSLPIRNGLEIAEDLANISKEKGDYFSYAERLEELVLGGKISIGEHGELNYSQKECTNLRINLAASMIKSLASLVVYLRHQAKKGDLLIIDEPELNLHPSSQCKLARFLCELTNSGIDIIISTHSDYIIREINNSILLKNPSLQKIKEKYKYSESQLISDKKVSVVIFNSEGNPEQISVGKKGFSVNSIDEQIMLQNQIAEDISLEWDE